MKQSMNQSLSSPNKSKIKILHLITGLNVGGAEMALSRLVSGMDKEKYNTCVVSMIKPGPVGDLITKSGIAIYSLDIPQGKISLNGFLKFIKILHQFQPDILQTWLYHADLLGLIAGKLTGVRSILWNIRCSAMDIKESPLMSKVVTKICAILSPIPNAIIANSKTGIKDHQNLGYRPREWFLIPNGIDTSVFKPESTYRAIIRREFGLNEKNIVVGLVGRLHLQKDHPNFLHAASIIHKDNKDIIFFIVGDGPDNYKNELLKLANSLSIEKNIIWAGSRHDMPQIYNCFDCLVLSSAYGEGFPNVIAEGMASGIPCISTNIGDASEIVETMGTIIPPGNPKILADSILELLHKSEEEKKQISLLSRLSIIEKYELAKMINIYSSYYEYIFSRQ